MNDSAPVPVAARTQRRSWVLALVGVACLAMGGGSLQVAAALPTASARPVGGNLPIGLGATDLRNIDANNSPSLVRNPARPNNLAVANRVDTPRFSCALHVSLDGGATWDKTAIPFPDGEELPPRCFAPDVAFDADGTLYVSFVTLIGLGNTPNAGWLATSEDGGRTLSAPARIEPLGPLAFQIRLTADPVTSGRLYLSWVQAAEVALLQFPTDDNPILFSRSDDGGLTWRAPVRVNPPERKRVVAPSVAPGADGRLYLLYLDLGNDLLDYRGAHEGRGGEPYPGPWSLVLARSGDEGRTWDTTEVDGALVPVERLLVFLPPAPSLAVDRTSGRVYVAFHDGRLGDADVWLWASGDGGRSFSGPRRVNDTRPRDGTWQYLPRASVAPDGRLDIVYYDRRSDHVENVRNDVSLQFSTDSGKTFSPRLRLNDQSFDSRIGFGSERGLPDLGSRLALLSTESRTMAVWTDTRGGSEASGKQDLARAVVAFSPASPLRQPLRVGGFVLLGLGAVALVWGLIPRRLRVSPAPAGSGGLAAPAHADDGLVEPDVAGGALEG
ncbi:MAG: glycoside hydrolase, partial [Actinobacteria bacterium]|nr:glycoside hydrolase [Actinomycetota bacterium]